MRRGVASVPVLLFVLAVGGAGSASAAVKTTTFRETFTGGANEGAWTLGNAADRIETSGGNPGAYLRNDFLDTFAPQPRTTAAVSEFTGDYRARQVQGVGADFIVFSTDFPSGERPLSLILTSSPGGPDECQVYFIGARDVPLEGDPWKKFRFLIPSSSPVMPPGWNVLNGCSGLNEDEAWNRVITDVDELRYFFGNPTFFFIFQIWDIGMDNPSIRTAIP